MGYYLEDRQPDLENSTGKFMESVKNFAARHVGQTRQLLRKLLVGRLRFEPVGEGLVRFTGKATLAPVPSTLEILGPPAGGTRPPFAHPRGGQ